MNDLTSELGHGVLFCLLDPSSENQGWDIFPLLFILLFIVPSESQVKEGP